MRLIFLNPDLIKVPIPYICNFGLISLTQRKPFCKLALSVPCCLVCLFTAYIFTNLLARLANNVRSMFLTLLTKFQFFPLKNPWYWFPIFYRCTGGQFQCMTVSWPMCSISSPLFCLLDFLNVLRDRWQNVKFNKLAQYFFFLSKIFSTFQKKVPLRNFWHFLQLRLYHWWSHSKWQFIWVSYHKWNTFKLIFRVLNLWNVPLTWLNFVQFATW